MYRYNLCFQNPKFEPTDMKDFFNFVNLKLSDFDFYLKQDGIFGRNSQFVTKINSTSFKIEFWEVQVERNKT